MPTEKRSVSEYHLDCRCEISQTSIEVGKIYRKNVLDGASTRVMFTTKIAYGLQVYEIVSKYGQVDFKYYMNAHPADFGVTPEVLNYPDRRVRTKFIASPSLIEHLDTVKLAAQEVLTPHPKKVYRNSVITYLFRLVIDYDRGTVHYVENRPDYEVPIRRACYGYKRKAR